jgi:hypothetical protein
MSAPLADDVQTSLGTGSRCKGSEIFLIKQIFDKKTERFVQPPRWIGLLLLMSFTHKQ